ELAAREVLLAHARRPETARGRDGRLDAPSRGRRAAPQGGGIVPCQSGGSSRAAGACSFVVATPTTISPTKSSTTSSRPRPHTWRAGSHERTRGERHSWSSGTRPSCASRYVTTDGRI